MYSCILLHGLFRGGYRGCTITYMYNNNNKLEMCGTVLGNIGENYLASGL